MKKLIGPGQPITRLTTYTMNDELEQDDQSLHPYGKSLLYLVSQAFEDAVPTPILGLQKSLKQDLPLIRFFGLAGTEKVADIVFPQTAAAAPLNARTQSITHGGFDNDIATMTSVIRRVLDVADATPWWTTSRIPWRDSSVRRWGRRHRPRPPGEHAQRRAGGEGRPSQHLDGADDGSPFCLLPSPF